MKNYYVYSIHGLATLFKYVQSLKGSGKKLKVNYMISNFFELLQNNNGYDITSIKIFKNVVGYYDNGLSYLKLLDNYYRGKKIIYKKNNNIYQTIKSINNKKALGYNLKIKYPI